MKKIIFLLFVFTLSCSSSKKTLETDVMNCVRNKINKNEYGLNYDIYKKLFSFEEYLLSEKILDSNNKHSYINLFESFEKKDFLKKDNNFIQNYIKELGLPTYSFASQMLIDCPRDKVSEAIQDNEHYSKSLLIFYLINEKFVSVGYGDVNNIISLITLVNEDDFKKEIYRMPVTLLFLMKYEEQLINNFGNGSE
jgi:hypothetical protein